jgi:shikimate dehydrogenase
MKRINAATRLCILIGDPVGHSVSPDIHNAAFSALGLNCAYLACRVQDLKAATAGLRGLGILGASVTIPHKQKIMAFLDEVSPLAKKIGAVNTIVNQGGRMIGHNTDGEAAYLSLIKNHVNPAGKKTVVLGAGGAARAIVFSLAGKPRAGEFVIFDIDWNKASALAREAQAKTGAEIRPEKMRPENLRRELEDASVLINASPVGMYPRINQSPAPKAVLHKRLAVFDIVYNPARTLLLEFARSAGCKTIPGLEMLVRQAGEQFRLWTHKNPPLPVMFRAGKKGLAGIAR